MEDLSVGKSYSSSEYIRYKKAMEARITSLWGWPSRDTSLSHRTEYYLLYRTLTFRCAQAILRTHIVDQLNLLLERLKFNSQITMCGIPTPEFILEMRQKMTKGSVSFMEALEATSLYKTPAVE